MPQLNAKIAFRKEPVSTERESEWVSLCWKMSEEPVDFIFGSTLVYFWVVVLLCTAY